MAGGGREGGRCSVVKLERGGFAANPRALSGCDYMVNKKKKEKTLCCFQLAKVMRI